MLIIDKDALESIQALRVAVARARLALTRRGTGDVRVARIDLERLTACAEGSLRVIDDAAGVSSASTKGWQR